jgi:hypothetical protein
MPLWRPAPSVGDVEKQLDALKRHDYLEKMEAGELDAEQKQKSSPTAVSRCLWLNGSRIMGRG